MKLLRRLPQFPQSISTPDYNLDDILSSGYHPLASVPVRQGDGLRDRKDKGYSIATYINYTLLALVLLYSFIVEVNEVKQRMLDILYSIVSQCLPRVARSYAVVRARSPAFKGIATVHDPFTRYTEMPQSVILLFNPSIRHTSHT